ncbi:hypothetical protein [Halomonas sp. IOP_31]|uniref:hypothetical protein n=1 Tax=Halomonas sp. IOP_31 TaxID=2876584 RepID=UPI001E367895|nr:hypothetical protein [Halomonas sp. IOP_31]MCD6008194.1 hypothetical protein [Halomonas sp. IOP_31]
MNNHTPSERPASCDIHRPAATAVRDPGTPLEVRPLSGRRELALFARLPGRLLHDDPQWVEPLYLERRLHLTRNPAFEHLTWQGFIAWSGGRPVGRISAHIDSLHRQYHGADTGHFGMLDAIDDPDVFAALFDAAEAWLRQHGARRISGPYSFTINEECGLLVEGFDTPPSMMMGHAGRYYATHVEAQGYTPAKDLLAYWMSTHGVNFTPTMRRMINRWRERIHIRPLRRDRFNEELDILRDIFNDAWAQNWGFVPFTDAEFRELGTSLKMLVPPELIQIAEIDAKPVAFIVGLPNLNEAIAPLHGRLLPLGWLRLLWALKVRGPKTGRVPLMGVRREYQHSRLGPTLALVLVESIQASLIRHGIEAVEMSWILEDNAGMRNILEHIGTDLYKRYRLYEKHL